MSSFSASAYSPLPLPYLILLALAALWIGIRVKRFYRHDLRHLPGPLLARFSGLYRLSMVGGGKGPAGYRELHRKYGQIVRVGPNHVAVSDSAAIPVIYGLGSKYTKVRITSLLRVMIASVLTTGTIDGILQNHGPAL
jgi:hypothetical protein